MHFFVPLNAVKAPIQGLSRKAKRLDASMERARRDDYRGAFCAVDCARSTPATDL